MHRNVVRARTTAIASAAAAVLSLLAGGCTWDDTPDESLSVQLGRAESRAGGRTTSTTAVHSPTTSTTVVGEPWQLTLGGVGPIRIGMTVDQAEEAGEVELRLEPGSEGSIEDRDCGYVHPRPDTGLALMVVGGMVVRVDVTGPSYSTLSGVQVGSTESDVLSTYGTRIRPSRHAYAAPPARYLTYVPLDPSERSTRIVFETDRRSKVTQFRVGLLPYVEYVEGCS